MSSQGGPKAEPQLTERQLECLEGFWQRKSAKQIGHELEISDHAVNKHLAVVRRRLGVNSTAEAARMVFEGTRKTAINYYSQELGVQDAIGLSDQNLASGYFVSEVAGDQGLINTLGPSLTLLAILAVAIGSIFAVAALIAAAQGLAQLWKAVGY